MSHDHVLVLNTTLSSDLIGLGQDHFGLLGCFEGELHENEIDDLLADHALCSTLPSKEQLEHLEKTLKSKSDSTQELYFSTKHAAQDFAYFLFQKGISVKYDSRKQKDWNALWNAQAQDIQIGESFLIKTKESSNHQQGNLSESSIQDPPYEVKIRPGLGFGTGHHESTALCLRAFEALACEKMDSILDFGCGSGILGLSAALLLEKKWGQRAEVDFVDMDPDALENAKNNAELNDEIKKNTLSFTLSQSPPKNEYQICFANILAPVLMEKGEELYQAMAPDGLLILSGLLKSDEKMILELYQSLGLQFERSLTQGEWMALVFKKET